MAKKQTPNDLVPTGIDDSAYRTVLTDVADLIESARHAAARSVNAVMTATYWEVGRRIVEEEQRGKAPRRVWRTPHRATRRTT